MLAMCPEMATDVSLRAPSLAFVMIRLLFVVMVISILVFSVFTSIVHIKYKLLKVLFKLMLLPIVVAISYEINRFVGRHDNWFTRAISWPGMWLQNFTTNEPDDSMIEVAIRSLELVTPEAEGADEW